MKKLVIALLALSLLLLGCASNPAKEAPAWQTTQLKDVRNGLVFTIADLPDKPTLIQSFATWSPPTTWQQHEMAKLQNIVGSDVSLLSLNIDPREDERIILKHLQEYGFNWHYANVPTAMREALIEEFNVSIVNAPQAPVVLLCPNGDARLLESGLKRAPKLQEEIATCI